MAANAADIAAKDLIGTWRLVGSRATALDGTELPPPWGPEPMGRLVLAANGRMMAVLCDGRAVLPDGMARMSSSYCGVYEIADGVLTTTVDGAADPARIGSLQVRRLEMQGDRLVLIPPRRADGSQRALVWQLAEIG